MRQYDFTIHGNEYHVELQSFEDNIAEVDVNGTTFKVEVKREIKKQKTPVLVRRASVKPTGKDTPKTESPLAPKGAGVIKAPLPGTIFKMNVKAGDEVKKGDVLLIMEAMKMENNIESDMNGKVLSVKVKENDSVLEGDILLEIGG